MDKENSRGHRKPEPQPEDERRGLGKRIAAARTLAGFTLDTAAQALLERGYPITRAAIGHWETGKNLPDALWLRRLAKLYGSTLDALVWDDAISMEAIRFAAQYDGLTEKQRRAFKAMWLAYFEQARSDADVGEHLPMPPAVPSKQHS
jgi:transcriptional regulator with XRE-family HTH domain